MVSVLEEMSYASTRDSMSSNNCTRKNCVRFWVKGFKVKVDEEKSGLYLKRAGSLVLTVMASGGRYDTRTRWPCLTLGHTGLTTGSSLSSTSPMLESRQVGHVFKRIKVWIFMYNLLILMFTTNFFFPE